MQRLLRPEDRMMMHQISGARLTDIAAILMFFCTGHAIADDLSLPTALAKRGKLILDDDGSKDRGGKTMIELNDGIGLKTASQVAPTIHFPPTMTHRPTAERP